MKKILFLMTLVLLTAASGFAQDVYEHTIYTIQFKKNDGTNVTDGSGTSYLTASSSSAVTCANSDQGETSQWNFIPVGGTEPGWYYIRNVRYENSYLTTDNATGTFRGDASLTGSIGGSNTKWRLINPSNNNMGANGGTSNRFKLSTICRNGNNAVLFRRRDNISNPHVRTATSFTFENSIVEILPVNTSSFVSNSDDELVTNYAPTSGYFNPTSEFSSNATGTDGKPVYASTSMFPVGYTRSSTNVSLVHNNSASGGLVGDGYYFARLPQNQTIFQTMKNPVGNIGQMVEVTLWVRATSSATNHNEWDNSETYAVPDGFHVGYVTIEGLSPIPITIPNISTNGNDPDGWYFYRMSFEITGNALAASREISVQNVMVNSADILDVDNIQVEYIDYDKLDFYYQTTNDPQEVHERTQVIYTPEGTTAEISAAAQGYVYYRWYTYNGDNEIYDKNLTPANPSSDLRRISEESGEAGGHVYFNLTNDIRSATVGSTMRFTPPTGFNSIAGGFYKFTCDASTYMNYEYEVGENEDENDIFTEPTLSWKHHFEIRPAWQIAAAINDSLSRSSVLEIIDLEAPYGTADNAPFTHIRIAPQYAVTNYWLSATGTDQNIGSNVARGVSFTWYKVASNGNRTEITGTETETIGGEVEKLYSFPALTRNNRFLQINTSNKGRNPAPETFEVDVTAGTTTKTVARFNINYVTRSSSGPIVPLSGKDLLSELPNKIFVTKESFDRDNNNLFGMGTEKLGQSETTYGFVNPASFTEGGGGYHYGRGVGNSAEYSFPQAANSEITSGTAYGWATQADVADRTYINTNGAQRGNFMYINGAELDATFITLDITEELCVGSELWFSAWVANLNDAAATDMDEVSTARPNLIFTLICKKEGKEPEIIKRFYTGDIGYEEIGQAGIWRNIAFKFTVPQSDDSDEIPGSHIHQLQIKNNGITSSGNDFALDEISIYISNPGIDIVRITENYCEGNDSLKYKFSVIVPEDYRPSVASEEVQPLAASGILYYRLLYDTNNGQVAFPEEAYGDPGWNETSGYYGIIDLTDLESLPNGITYSSTGDTLTIKQAIPASVLEELPVGTYTFQMSASPTSLGTGCSGIASFVIKYDEFRFKAKVHGTSTLVAPEEIQTCTSNIVDVTIEAIDGVSGATIKEAYFDWYYGPINTESYIGEEEENVEWDPDINFIGYNGRTIKFDSNGEFDEDGTGYSVKNDLVAFRGTPGYEKITNEGLKTLPTNVSLVNRMRYYVDNGILHLYDLSAPVPLNTVARYFITAIPAPSPGAYVLRDGQSTEERKDICYGLYQTMVPATDWGSDIVFGEVTNKGEPITEYPDTYEYEDYIYTVRLPEKDKDGNDNREQFVAPMLYIDEAHLVQIYLLKVNGEFLGTDEDDPTTGIKVDDPYIGVISEDNPNKIDKTHFILADREYNPDLSPYYTQLGSYYPLYTAWNLDGDREARSGALEAYPLTYTSYNYYVTDPIPDHNVVLEGDPYRIGTKINGVELDNNRIALEIPAMGLLSERLRQGSSFEDYIDFSGSSEEDYKAQFKVGYEYDFVVRARASDSWEVSSTCDQYFYFKMKVVPDTVYWTGTKSADWNDDTNWTGAGDLNGFAPTTETRVILPSSLSSEASYPVLNDPEALETATPFIEFDYNFSPNTASEIQFKNGSKLGNQFYLDYDSASIDLNLATMRWYALSAPLRDMYSGDYSFDRTNPVVEMKVFNIENPQTGINNTDWSNSFSTTNERLTSGQGFSVRVGENYYPDLQPSTDFSDLASDYTRTFIDDKTFNFPKNTLSYQFWDPFTKAKLNDEIEYIPDGGRDFNKRFIYETTETEDQVKVSKVPEGNVLAEVPVNRTEGGESVVVGNPFMAHLNFAAFYKENRNVIKAEYKILDQTGVVSWSATSDQEGNLSNIVATGGLDSLSIPPMQAFMVTTNSEYSGSPENLVITKNMNTTKSSSVLRSSENRNEENTLRIFINKNAYQAEAVVRFESTASDRYLIDEDSRRMSVSGSISQSLDIFTIADNMYLDINRMQQITESIPLGILTKNKGMTTIRIKGADSMPSFVEFTFRDVEKNISLPIDDNFEYNFNNEEGNQIGRFYIESRDYTSINEIKSRISIYKNQDVIYISSNDGEELKEVSIYGTDGKTLLQRKNVKTSFLSVSLPVNHSIVIVKAVTDKNSVTRKILN